MIGEATARLTAEIEAAKQAERDRRRGNSGGAGPKGLTFAEGARDAAIERAYWERKLSEVDPAIQAVIRALLGRVATLEAEAVELRKLVTSAEAATAALEKRTKKAIEAVSKKFQERAVGRNGRAPAGPPPKK